MRPAQAQHNKSPSCTWTATLGGSPSIPRFNLPPARSRTCLRNVLCLGAQQKSAEIPSASRAILGPPQDDAALDVSAYSAIGNRQVFSFVARACETSSDKAMNADGRLPPIRSSAPSAPLSPSRRRAATSTALTLQVSIARNRGPSLCVPFSSFLFSCLSFSTSFRRLSLRPVSLPALVPIPSCSFCYGPRAIMSLLTRSR